MDEAIIDIEENTYKVYVGPYEETVNGAITIEKVKEIAKKYHIAKAIVRKTDGTILRVSDFPYEGDIKIEQYNEAKA